MTRFVGIDEAGYGPNIGPLVMAAVIAESVDDHEPDVWGDLETTVSRARGPADRLWIDDSKAILKAGKGRDRLDRAAMAVLRATGRPAPSTMAEWLSAVHAGTLSDVELSPWLDAEDDDPRCPATVPDSPLTCDRWRILGVRAVVVGPSRFNADLDATRSKADAHFRAYARLLAPIWDEAAILTFARCDKHGGRNFYLGPLSESFPEAWIDRGEEGPERSLYTLRDPARRLHLEFRPRADSEDGLVAMASIVAKSLRESWMDQFNAFWRRRIPGLKPTAGYPVDAARFRSDIAETTLSLGLATHRWWRTR